MLFDSLINFANQSVVVQLVQYFLVFLLYSFIGWIVECLWVSLHKGKFENRGFLFGPICPIYGVGSLACVILVSPLNLPWFLEFILIMVVCDTIEYLTSLVLEKIYHVRWWDYTTSCKIHLNGRIALNTSLGFGLSGLVVLRLVQPSLKNFLDIFSTNTLFVVSIILLVILLFDLLLSSIAAASVKDTLKGGRVDLTAEIKKLSLNYYRKASRLSRKISRLTIRRMKLAQRQASRKLKWAKRNATRNFKKTTRAAKDKITAAHKTAKRTIDQAKKRVEETFKKD